MVEADHVFQLFKLDGEHIVALCSFTLSFFFLFSFLCPSSSSSSFASSFFVVVVVFNTLRL